MSAGGLLLDGEDDYDRLVNQPSSVLPEQTLVVPNDVKPPISFIIGHG